MTASPKYTENVSLTRTCLCSVFLAPHVMQNNKTDVNRKSSSGGVLLERQIIDQGSRTGVAEAVVVVLVVLAGGVDIVSYLWLPSQSLQTRRGVKRVQRGPSAPTQRISGIT
ncbi:unnamed protein product [Arctogadus glacialis]